MSCTWLAGREAEREGNRKGDGGGALNEEQLERLARYFDEEVMSSRNYKPPYLGRLRFHAQSYLMTPGTCAGSPGVIHCKRVCRMVGHRSLRVVLWRNGLTVTLVTGFDRKDITWPSHHMGCGCGPVCREPSEGQGTYERGTLG